MTLDRPYSILVTDDDPAARETVREIFESAGYRHLLAESGEEAIDIAQQNDIHLAVMDMHLPKLTGLETMAIVRQIKGIMPMILVSADHDDGLLRKALSAQAYSVLSKPVSRQQLTSTVDAAMRRIYNWESNTLE